MTTAVSPEVFGIFGAGCGLRQTTRSRTQIKNAMDNMLSGRNAKRTLMRCQQSHGLGLIV